jgi:hypothetical protein
MQSAALLEKGLSDLHAENGKQKQKRAKSRRQVLATEGLLVTEALILSMPVEEAIEAAIPRQIVRLYCLCSQELGPHLSVLGVGK